VRTLVAPLWQQPMLIVLLLLSTFGVGMIYSAGVLEVTSSVTQGLWIRQATFLGVAVVACLIVARIPLRWFEWVAVPGYILGVGVLAVTLVVGTGTGTAEGISSFLSIGGFRFQPAEAAKISTALALAREGVPVTVLDRLAEVGIDRVAVVVGSGAERVADALHPVDVRRDRVRHVGHRE